MSRDKRLITIAATKDGVDILNKRTVLVNGKSFTLTELSPYGYSLSVRLYNQKYDKNHSIIKNVNEPFNKWVFQRPHTPMIIESEVNRNFADIRDFEVNSMPIKMAHSYEYRIPTELRQFEKVIAKAISFEHEVNVNVNEFYCYLTISQEKVAKCRDDSRPGCKTYGMPLDNSQRRLGRSYIIYDCLPPVFYPQKIEVAHMSLKENDFFAEFDEQIDEKYATIYDPYQLLCITPYSIHREQKAYNDTYRTYVRITYDKEVYNRFGNTKNPMFIYEWNMKVEDLTKS